MNTDAPEVVRLPLPAGSDTLHGVPVTAGAPLVYYGVPNGTKSTAPHRRKVHASRGRSQVSCEARSARASLTAWRVGPLAASAPQDQQKQWAPREGSPLLALPARRLPAALLAWAHPLKMARARSTGLPMAYNSAGSKSNPLGHTTVTPSSSTRTRRKKSH